MSDRFDDLLADFLEGDLDERGVAELQTLLEREPGLAPRAADFYELHRGLGLLHQEKDPGAFARGVLGRLRSDRDGFVGSIRARLGGKHAPRRPWSGYVLVAAATLIFSFTLQVLLTRPADLPSGPVATLVRNVQSRWEPDVPLADGERLSPGPLRLSRGSAVLLFDGGVLMALHGPADLEILTRGSVRLRHGRVLVRSEQDVAGFSVRTPAGEALDLGTEFALAVELSGATELHVQEGEVAWTRDSGGAPAHVLKAGEARRFDGPHGGGDRSVAFLVQSLEDTLRQISFEVRPARAVAAEDFEYAPGDQGLPGLDGGSGWKGAWRLRRGRELTKEPDPSNRARISEQGLQGPWFPTAERGGSLALPPGNRVYLRSLAEPVDLGRDAVYYISYLLRREPDAPAGSSEVPHFRLTLRSSQDYWGASVSAGLPFSRRPNLQFHSRSNFPAPVEVEIGASTLWILKIVSGRSRPDEIFLKVFRGAEGLPLFEPAEWSVVTGPLVGEGVLDLVVVTGSGPATHVFDGLRVGRTWESVVRRD